MLISNIHLENLNLKKALIFYDEIYSLFHFVFFLYTDKINNLEKRLEQNEKLIKLFNKMKTKRRLLLKKFCIMLLNVV